MAYAPVISKYWTTPESWTLKQYQSRGEYWGYAAAKKAITEFEPKALTTYVKDSNLRGRGGAGFSTGLKWTFLPENGKPRYLAVNADESEPGTFKDRQILAYDPHQLIEGIIICCWAIQAKHAYVFVRGEFVREIKRLQAAIDECYAAGILGDDVLKLGKGFKLDITVLRGAGAYICGEETGLLSAAEGKRAYPKIKPPFPAVEGFFRFPTIVNNVETLSNLPHIIGKGKEWYMQQGPAAGPGPKLYCISGHVKKPGVYEAPLGTTLRTLIDEYAGGPIGTIKAIIPGGSSMPVFTPDLLDTPMDFDTVRAKGSFLGSAGVIVMNDSVCMVNALVNLAKFYHHESCGQCTPCREGLGWLEKLLHRLEFGHAHPGDLDLIKEVCGMVSKRTICLLSDSLVMPIESYMKAYFKEFEYHVKEKKCMTGGQPGVWAPAEEAALAR
jgi:NADH-quinone oxidoreductase subunit F